MGWFFNRKKKDNKKEENKVSVENADNNAVVSSDNMTDVIKKERDDEIINPFAENVETPKSIAKMYGTKYIGVSNGQLASSKVVDVRSYVKPTETPKIKPIDLVSDGEGEKKKPTRDLFDELFKSIDDEKLEDEPEESLFDDEPKKEEVKPEPPKKEKSKKPAKKKKGIDIDIITGDFGGGDSF